MRHHFLGIDQPPVNTGYAGRPGVAISINEPYLVPTLTSVRVYRRRQTRILWQGY